MNPYLKIIRLNVGVLAAFAVLVGALVSNYFDVYMILLSCFIVFLIVSSGNTLNDYFDYKIDSINKKHRPIPSGKIKRKHALMFSIILFIISMILIPFLNIYMVILAVINIPLLILYNYKIKRMSIGHVVDAWFAASPLLFGALLAMNISLAVWILFIMAYLGNLCREITKGVEDMTADMKAGAKTLSIALGEKASKYVATISILIAISLTPIPYIYNLLGFFYIPLVIICDLTWLYAVRVLFKDAKKSQKIMKMAMFLGIFAFLAGII